MLPFSRRMVSKMLSHTFSEIPVCSPLAAGIHPAQQVFVVGKEAAILEDRAGIDVREILPAA